jgi:endonuclease/exonuclease/phosphatase family metal-dependent hydrolase
LHPRGRMSLRAPALAAALGLSCAPALPVPPASASGAGVMVRVATWNVHDLFDAEDRLLPPGDRDDVPAPAEVEAKLARVAAVLVRLDADVVLLQEVENAALLDRLAALAGYPEARLVEGGDPRGIDVAALSRLPVRAYVSHGADRDAAGRPLWPRDCVELHVHAGAASPPLVLLASHLSSALSDDGTRRAAQAARLRELADELRAGGAGVVAGGDLNDGPDSEALAPLLADGAWVRAGARLPPDGAWTWSGGGRREVLDHLLVPAGGGPAALAAWVADGADVAAASDHRPLVADLWVE